MPPSDHGSETITVRFAGPLRDLAGRRQMTLALGTRCTLRQVLEDLAHLLPRAFVEQVIDPQLTGEAPPALLLVNASSPDGRGLDRQLAPGDVIAFVPPMSGG